MCPFCIRIIHKHNKKRAIIMSKIDKGYFIIASADYPV
ncbi:hypothetical protein RV15_GL003157 [Enterococcus silesiacus]|uniref:Uncharacterized protein n=1 Tax=Enterococcus silesiacus TaxID=332949 RepID=A0AA91GC27_9ENTE|nr:hypothetical protein RV15_GL003157 [Enterococcus silesiacus]